MNCTDAGLSSSSASNAFGGSSVSVSPPLRPLWGNAAQDCGNEGGRPWAPAGHAVDAVNELLYPHYLRNETARKRAAGLECIFRAKQSTTPRLVEPSW